jgi:hypothetical protein
MKAELEKKAEEISQQIGIERKERNEKMKAAIEKMLNLKDYPYESNFNGNTFAVFYKEEDKWQRDIISIYLYDNWSNVGAFEKMELTVSGLRIAGQDTKKAAYFFDAAKIAYDYNGKYDQMLSKLCKISGSYRKNSIVLEKELNVIEKQLQVIENTEKEVKFEEFLQKIKEEGVELKSVEIQFTRKLSYMNVVKAKIVNEMKKTFDLKITCSYADYQYDAVLNVHKDFVKSELFRIYNK